MPSHFFPHKAFLLISVYKGRGRIRSFLLPHYPFHFISLHPFLFFLLFPIHVPLFSLHFYIQVRTIANGDNAVGVDLLMALVVMTLNVLHVDRFLDMWELVDPSKPPE